MFRTFEKLLDPFQPYDDQTPPPGDLIGFMRTMLWPARKVLAVALISSLLIAVGESALIYFSGRLIDMLSQTAPEDFWATHKSDLLLMLFITGFAVPVLIVLDTLIMNQSIFPNLGALVRWRTHRHVLRQSLSFFQDDFAGRIANKQIQLAPAIGDALYELIDAMWFALIYLISITFILGELDPRLLIPLGIWFLGWLTTAFWFIPAIQRSGKVVAEARSTLAGRIVDSYTNIQTVKLFAHADREDDYARTALEEMRAAFARQTRIFTKMQIALMTVNTFLIVGSLAFAVWLWANAGLTVGAVAAASALVLRLNGMTYWIMFSLSTLFQNLGTAEEGIETVSEPWRMTDAKDAAHLTVDGGEIRFDGLSHHYGRQIGGVDRVDLTIRGGERIGLVGRSGAGKSTLVNLLLRFHDAETGRILIDDQDVALATQDSLRAQIGMVTQDTSLLHRSILDNIRYGRQDASMEEVRAAARKVSAHDFIMDLEDPTGRSGYDAHCGERGVKLSGGQRQRIALARAVLKNAPILVLDEATSALDSEVEAEIQTALYDLMEGKTVIAIAHRLSTIARMDRIIVLDEGRIAEQGTHAELLESAGLYASFWNRQSGGFIGVDTEDAKAD